MTNRPNIEKLLKDSDMPARLGGMTVFESREVHEACRYALELEASIKRLAHGVEEFGGNLVKVAQALFLGLDSSKSS